MTPSGRMPQNKQMKKTPAEITLKKKYDATLAMFGGMQDTSTRGGSHASTIRRQTAGQSNNQDDQDGRGRNTLLAGGLEDLVAGMGRKTVVNIHQKQEDIMLTKFGIKTDKVKNQNVKDVLHNIGRMQNKIKGVSTGSLTHQIFVKDKKQQHVLPL